MIGLASWLEFLWKLFFPEGGSTSNSGSLTIWVATAVLLTLGVSWMCKALEDQIKAAFRWLLGTWPRCVFVGIWFVFIAAATYLESWIMLLTAVVISPIVALARLGFRLPFIGVLAISLAAMAGSTISNWYYSRIERAGQKIYFVLSFEPASYKAAYTDDIAANWDDCRNKLRQVFSGIQSVKVQINPDTSDYKKYRWNEIQSNFEQIFRHGPPDAFVKATVSKFVIGESEAVKTLPELDHLVAKRQLESYPDIVWPYGDLIPDEDAPFLTFAISDWVWQWIKTHQANVQPSDSQQVNSNILRSYREFLTQRKVVDRTLLAAVDAALQNPTDENVVKVLNDYYEKLRKLVDGPEVAKGEEKKREIALNISQLGK